jgi:hypothetical protein
MRITVPFRIVTTAELGVPSTTPGLGALIWTLRVSLGSLPKSRRVGT